MTYPSRNMSALVCTLLLLGAADRAHAQDLTAPTDPVASPQLNAQNYRPSVDSRQTLWTDDASLGPSGYYQGRFFLHYANDPLVYLYEDGTETKLLSDVLQADAIGAITLSRLRLAVDVPLYLMAAGANEEGGGIGDIALDLKGVFLDPTETDGLGLGLSARTSLPTASTEASLGLPGVGWEIAAIASQRFGKTTLLANLGTRGTPEVEAADLIWNDQFTYRLGLGYALESDASSGLSADIAGAFTYGSPLSEGPGVPLEYLLGGWTHLTETLVLRGGVGSGLTVGIGSPDLRMVAALSYEPPTERDRDLDGIANRDDACPDDPEDLDGYRDVDGCPDPSTTVHITVQDHRNDFVYGAHTVVQTESGAQSGGAEFELGLHQGTYDIVVDAERYKHLEATVSVPAPSELPYLVLLTMEPLFGMLQVEVTDPEGTPIDAILVVDRNKPVRLTGGMGEVDVDTGDHLVFVRSNGYKPKELEARVDQGQLTKLSVVLEPAKARVTREKIEILEKVYFDTNKASIRPESFDLLDDVTEILKSNPDIRRIHVEGHTDSRGSASYNKKLSDRRAKAVRQYLVDRGISPSRVDATGFGEERPVDEREVAEAWDQNRRVEFVITERDEPE